MEEMTMKINYVPTDGDAGYAVEFIDEVVDYLLAMHYERGFYPSFIKEYMQKNREVSFIDCAEMDMDEMMENETDETVLYKKFIPANPDKIGSFDGTVGDWILTFISNEAIDAIIDGHGRWIMDFEYNDLSSFRGLLIKMNIRMMRKMSGPQNFNTIKSYVYQAIHGRLHDIAYED